MKKIIQAVSWQYHRVQKLYLKYERVLMPATLVLGFLVDYFTFSSIQIGITFTILSVYWLITGVTIFFITVYDTGRLQQFKYMRLFAPLAIQFTFGALLSASLIFYWFSGAFSVSWPLIIIIALLMVFNDAFRHYFVKPPVQISVYFFATISLLSIILPYLFNSLSAWFFVMAAAISLCIFLGYIHLLGMARRHEGGWQWRLLLPVLVIFFAMNTLYFFNITPPIPLALREAGLYHSIKPQGGKYIMQGEPENLLQNVLGRQVVHLQAGEKLYLYTAIFAPAELQTTIIHHWQYYDETQEKWLERGKLPFTINGGRKEGYKGYSFNSNLQPGKWRIYVENQRGQVLGRITFAVQPAGEDVELVEVVR